MCGGTRTSRRKTHNQTDLFENTITTDNSNIQYLRRTIQEKQERKQQKKPTHAEIYKRNKRAHMHVHTSDNRKQHHHSKHTWPGMQLRSLKRRRTTDNQNNQNDQNDQNDQEDEDGADDAAGQRPPNNFADNEEDEGPIQQQWWTPSEWERWSKWKEERQGPEN